MKTIDKQKVNAIEQLLYEQSVSEKAEEAGAHILGVEAAILSATKNMKQQLESKTPWSSNIYLAKLSALGSRALSAIWPPQMGSAIALAATFSVALLVATGSGSMVSQSVTSPTVVSLPNDVVLANSLELESQNLVWAEMLLMQDEIAFFEL